MKKLMKMLLSAVLTLCLIAAPALANGSVPAMPSAQPAETAAITAADIQALLVSCTGYAGTAGSSLKGVIAAGNVLNFCVENQLAQTDADALEQVLFAGYASLTDEQKQEIAGNMKYIFSVIDGLFTDYLSLEDLIDTAGMTDFMKPLLRSENAFAHYGVFKLTMLNVFGAFDELLISCTGYAGAAGSSMKNAAAAYGVLSFCIENKLAYADPAVLRDALSEAYAQLSEERMQELAWNMESISDLIAIAFIDYTSVEGLLDSVGAAEDMLLLIDAEGAYAHWAVFSLQMQTVFNENSIGE